MVLDIEITHTHVFLSLAKIKAHHWIDGVNMNRTNVRVISNFGQLIKFYINSIG